MGDVRDILKGGIMSQSHPAPSKEIPAPNSPNADSWKWTEYKSKYRPFSQYSYSAGSWHRNAPLDTTDGPSSWYAEVAERIHKAEEYKTRSRSSGIGDTEYPTERNRLIWSNSVSALTLHDTVDSSAGHRRQKSRFHSLGPTFPLTKDNKATATSAVTSRTAVKSRTSRSVSRRRPESKDVPDTNVGATSPTKSVARPQAAKPPVRKETDHKDVKSSKPRAVVKPTPAKEGDKLKDEKKWIKSTGSDTIDSKSKENTTKDTKHAVEKSSPPKATPAGLPTTTPSTTTATTTTTTPSTTTATSTTTTPATTTTTPATTTTTPATATTTSIPATGLGAAGQLNNVKSVSDASNTSRDVASQLEKAGTPAPVAKVADLVDQSGQRRQLAPSEPLEPQSKTTNFDSNVKPADTKSFAVGAPLNATVASTAAVSKSVDIDPMAQSFIDHRTIGGGSVATKPADFSMARSRLDEFWAEGK